MNDLARPDQPAVLYDDTLPGVVWIAGRSSEYSVDPVDEFIVAAPVGPDGYVLHRNGRSIVVPPTALVLLDPEHPHRGTPTATDGWDGRLLVLPVALWTAALDELPAVVRSPVSEPVLHAPKLRDRFLELHRSIEARSSQLERECALLALLEDVVAPQSVAARPRGDRIAGSVIEHLEDVFPRPVGLDALAAETGISKFQLLRRFRAEFGLTPYQFHTSLRIAHARRLLATGTPIAETAAIVGFADQSHLHRNFRKRLGFTPAAFRDALARTSRVV